MAGRLNDTEVAQEMNKMIAFIKQEALEKARETKVKADEEFNIEKGKLVRAETVNIEAFFTKKVKQAEVQRKIATSHLINKNRLQVLQARQQVLNDLFADARGQLHTLTQDKAAYKSLLQNLILQGLYRLMEENVLIQVREVDFDVATEAIKDATVEFTKLAKVEITIDREHPLPSSHLGGLVIGTMDGRIKCENTLESRLELLQDQMLPDIRTMLFGPSKSRKFFN